MPRRKDPIHGFIYQLKLLMLFLHRGINLKYDFILRTEMEEAGSFDDLFFEYKKDKKTLFRLLQAKHSLDDKKKITTINLLAGIKEDQKYSLIKYYYSYMKCKNQKLFKGGSFKDLIICTNIDFDLKDLTSNGIIVHSLLEKDAILSINTIDGQTNPKNPKRYRFDISFIHKLKPELEKNYDSAVAKDLVDYILNDKTLHKKHFGNYINALTCEVIDKKNKKLKENFINNKDLTGRAIEFRDMFVWELQKQSKKKINLVTLNEKFQLNIPQAFGQNPNKKENQWPEKVIDDEDVLEFLNLLVFAVNQINEEELGEAIKREIGAQFNKITTESIYRNLFQHMVDFLQDKKKGKFQFWSFKDGEVFIRNTCFEIINLQLSGYRNHLDSIKFHFKETIFHRSQSFIESENPLWILTSKTPWLSTLAIYQSIRNNTDTMKIFIYKWNDLLDNDGKILLDFKGLDDFLIIITCFQIVGTEDITVKLVETIEQLLFEQKSKSKKVIVIASQNHKLRRQLLLKHENCHSQELNIGFNDMTETSQRLLLEKENISFQGNHRLSLHKLLNINELDTQQQIEMLNLDASAIELLLCNSEINIFDQTNDFNSFTYKPNKAVTFDNMIKEIKLNTLDIFAFLGDEEEIKAIFSDQEFDLVRFNVTDSSNLIINHRFILLDYEREATEFNLLCKMIYDYTFISPNKSALHKMKYIGNNKWIWMETFDRDFYINRHYNPNIIGLSLLRLLSDINFSDFILFSGLKRNIALREIHKYYRAKKIEFDPKINERNFRIIRSNKRAKQTFDFLSKTVEKRLSSTPNDADLTTNIFKYKKKAVHWIKLQKVLDSSNTRILRLDWQQSYGDVLTMRNRRNLDIYFPPEENLIDLNQRIMLLIDGPGTGKSCILTRLIQNLKKKKPTSLIIEINLNKLQGYVTSFSINTKVQLINLLFRVLKKSSVHVIERKIIEYKMEQDDQLILLFDGFDEVCKELQGSVLNLFKFVTHKTKANLWVTARPQNKEKLEASLCVLSYSFKLLSKPEQIDFLSHFWKASFKFSGTDSRNFDFKRYAISVTQHFNLIAQTFHFSSFIEIPLMLRSVAETFLSVFTDVLLKNAENGSTIEKKIQEINFTDTFESFVRRVYDIYFFEKIKIVNWFDKESQAVLKDAYSNAYRCLAVKHICRNVCNPMPYLDDKKATFSLLTLSKIGLIQTCNNQKIYQFSQTDSLSSFTCDSAMYDFIHPSFAECFAAEFICIELKNNSESEKNWEFLIGKILFRPFSRRVFDDKLEKDKELSNLSSNKLQKRIVFNLLDEQVKQYGAAETLWKAAESKLKRTVTFLTKWYVDPKCYNFFDNHYQIAAKRILNLDANINAIFPNTNNIVDYIMGDHLENFTQDNEPYIFIGVNEHSPRERLIILQLLNKLNKRVVVNFNRAI